MTIGKRFKVGDSVKPKPEWVGDPNNIPSGAVRAIARFGTDGALYVGEDHRAFVGDVFEMQAP